MPLYFHEFHKLFSVAAVAAREKLNVNFQHIHENMMV